MTNREQLWNLNLLKMIYIFNKICINKENQLHRFFRFDFLSLYLKKDIIVRYKMVMILFQKEVEHFPKTSLRVEKYQKMGKPLF